MDLSRAGCGGLCWPAQTLSPLFRIAVWTPGLLCRDEVGGRFEVAAFPPLFLKKEEKALCLSAFLGHLSSP